MIRLNYAKPPLALLPILCAACTTVHKLPSPAALKPAPQREVSVALIEEFVQMKDTEYRREGRPKAAMAEDEQNLSMNEWLRKWQRLAEHQSVEALENTGIFSRVMTFRSDKADVTLECEHALTFAPMNSFKVAYCPLTLATLPILHGFRIDTTITAFDKHNQKLAEVAKTKRGRTTIAWWAIPALLILPSVPQIYTDMSTDLLTAIVHELYNEGVFTAKQTRETDEFF